MAQLTRSQKLLREYFNLSNSSSVSKSKIKNHIAQKQHLKSKAADMYKPEDEFPMQNELMYFIYGSTYYVFLLGQETPLILTPDYLIEDFNTLVATDDLRRTVILPLSSILYFQDFIAP